MQYAGETTVGKDYMKKIYAISLALCLYASVPLFAIDEQEIAQFEVIDPIETYKYQFEVVLRALDHTDVRTDKYDKVICVGIGLIETASNHGLVLPEKLEWYRLLYHKHNEILSQFINSEAMVNSGDISQDKRKELGSTRLHLLALKKVLINKMMIIVKEIQNRI